MKYKVSLKDGIDLLVEADGEVDAVRKAKEVKDALSGSGSARRVEDTATVLSDAGEYGNYDLKYFLSLPKSEALQQANDSLKENERQLPYWETYGVKEVQEFTRKRETMTKYMREQIAGIKNVIREINKKS